jgi:hypothetical protein
MNDIETLVNSELADLIEHGESFISAAQNRGNRPNAEEKIELTAWITRIGQLLSRIYEPNSQYLKSYTRVIDNYTFTTAHSNYYDHLCQVNGILNSVRHELENGLLIDVKRLLQSEVFADFLGMAEYLLKEGYKDASAVLIGGVLEDTLRQIAIENDISIEKPNGRPKTIEPLNIDLAKAEVYDKLIQKQITSWGDLRNSAAHGNYDNYDKKQVEMMLLFVQKFSSDYLH